MRHERIKLVALTVIAGTMAQTATLTLDVEGVHHTRQGTGNGPVDAIFNAIRSIVPHDGASWSIFQVHAVTGGSDAQAEVSVKLKEKDGLRSATGRGADPDTLVACARAYIAALNKLVGRSAAAAATTA